MQVQRKPIRIQHANQLPDTTLVVIGLWNMGYTDLQTAAKKLLVVDERPLRRLFRMLATTRDPLIRRYVDFGLPPGVHRRFPFADTTIRCRLCGGTVESVPCPLCALKFGGCDADPRCFREVPLKIPVRRTGAAPGSPQKIAVMRARIGRGESAFHPKDASLPKKACREPQ
jgi:hypothetical protein